MPVAYNAAGLNETQDELPTEVRTLIVSPDDYLAGGKKRLRFQLINTNPETALYIRLSVESSWISLSPQEATLGPGEKQPVEVLVQIDVGRSQLLSGGSPAAPITIHSQQLGRTGSPALPLRSGMLYVRLPIAICPSCEKTLNADLSGGATIPELCPFCYERLRPCPHCGTPNTWRAKRCIADPNHVVRAQMDWTTLGGGPGHFGARDPSSLGLTISRETQALSLTRRWSYPTLAPSNRAQVLSWSAPVAAYGMVVAAASTSEGEAHLYAFQSETGAPLWDPYPLADPVYPDRGGIALSEGSLFAATVDGLLTCADALRGTRLWERPLEGKVYGAVVPSTLGGPLLVPLITPHGGALAQVGVEQGTVLCTTPLAGPVITTPAFYRGYILVHDDSGTLTCLKLETGHLLWSVTGLGTFKAAPVVFDNRVYSAAEKGCVRAFEVQTGKEIWQVEVTNAALSGTPACDGGLLYLPADDGVHLVSAAMGRSVRRYPTRHPVRSTPLVIGGAVLFGGSDGNVYGAVPGKPLEKLYETGVAGSQIVAAAAMADGAIFLTATNGVLYSLGLG